MSDFLNRIAGAPITWGVDGSPGWGHLMERDRVMNEMVETGLSATELGPDGYLPSDPAELKDYLAQHGLQLVGGFVPALLYRPNRLSEELGYASRAAQQLAAGGSKVMVLGPSTDHAGYDRSVEMDDDDWKKFFSGLEQLDDVVGAVGLATALHPHWGMAVERPQHIERFLDSCEVGLCLDTGHVYLGGGDPVEVAKMAGARVLHVHLKDVEPSAAELVRSGSVPFRKSVIEGMFVPLGEGGVDIAGVIHELEGSGFAGWYVIEQDRSLTVDPQPGEGPVVDAGKSVAYLRNLAKEL